MDRGIRSETRLREISNSISNSYRDLGNPRRDLYRHDVVRNLFPTFSRSSRMEVLKCHVYIDTLLSTAPGLWGGLETKRQRHPETTRL